MISSGARISRYLIQSIIGHYTKSNPVKHIKGHWCRSMKYSSFAHFVSIGASRYGDDFELGKGVFDTRIIENYVTTKRELGEDEVDERWLEVRAVFERFEFTPFDDKV